MSLYNPFTRTVTTLHQDGNLTENVIYEHPQFLVPWGSGYYTSRQSNTITHVGRAGYFTLLLSDDNTLFTAQQPDMHEIEYLDTHKLVALGWCVNSSSGVCVQANGVVCVISLPRDVAVFETLVFVPIAIISRPPGPCNVLCYEHQDESYSFVVWSYRHVVYSIQGNLYNREFSDTEIMSCAITQTGRPIVLLAGGDVLMLGPKTTDVLFTETSVVHMTIGPMGNCVLGVNRDSSVRVLHSNGDVGTVSSLRSSMGNCPTLPNKRVGKKPS